MGNTITSKDVHIFISHADCDRELANALVLLLMQCFGVQANQICCTSFIDTGVPIGQSFPEHIVKSYNESEICFYLLTDQYLNRQNCIIELGWILQRPQANHFLVDVRADWSKSKFPSMLSHLQRYKLTLAGLGGICSMLEELGLWHSKDIDVLTERADSLLKIASDVQIPYYYINYTEDEKKLAINMLRMAYFTVTRENDCTAASVMETYHFCRDYLDMLFEKSFARGIMQKYGNEENPSYYDLPFAKTLLKSFDMMDEFGCLGQSEFEARIRNFDEREIKALVFNLLRHQIQLVRIEGDD